MGIAARPHRRIRVHWGKPRWATLALGTETGCEREGVHTELEGESEGVYPLDGPVPVEYAVDASWRAQEVDAALEVGPLLVRPGEVPRRTLTIAGVLRGGRRGALEKRGEGGMGLRWEQASSSSMKGSGQNETQPRISPHAQRGVEEEQEEEAIHSCSPPSCASLECPPLSVASWLHAPCPAPRQSMKKPSTATAWHQWLHRCLVWQ